MNNRFEPTGSTAPHTPGEQMTAELVNQHVAVSRWDRTYPTARVFLIVALVAAIATVFLTDTDGIRYASVVAILIIAPIIGWLRELSGPEDPLS